MSDEVRPLVDVVGRHHLRLTGDSPLRRDKFGVGRLDKGKPLFNDAFDIPTSFFDVPKYYIIDKLWLQGDVRRFGLLRRPKQTSMSASTKICI